MKFLLALVAVSILLGPCVAAEKAFLIVEKHALSAEAVEQKDFFLQYDLFNVGLSPAFEVSLNDTDAWPEEQWELVTGLLSASWEKILPGQNLSHSVVLRPKKPSVYVPNPAKVHYRPAAKSPLQLTFSTTLPAFEIESSRHYNQRHSLFAAEWLLFGALSAAPVGLPLAVWAYVQLYTEKAGSKKKSR
mmetsp:Transcript_25602/g.44128  ORF Transcript_25602/g.44128 Transcript_25602/m.44128 type:complete len:189 (-) Transcript_25602:32-598(-)|eukprot:CAMPEP_0196656454 /NCGR_PEP_ID=MMETSP1086-20130531/17392_1 /TAXON_ID=77921 /ORGANISM="Cyanoptyche  gloeocystis , Strain SAG4.97" /LENGTH=188 /DNA_ID=CAMNT_0041989207 /DNA_START=56 /DNA_END=622 /DNA_ORIENTATION=+